MNNNERFGVFFVTPQINAIWNIEFFLNDKDYGAN